jgi:hypothetical protein
MPEGGGTSQGEIPLIPNGDMLLHPRAQTDRSGLNGTATDPSGAVIQGVVVTAISEATGLRRETTTPTKSLNVRR